MVLLKDALDYEPVELDFGTSGLRGLVKDMTDLECYINVRGFLEFLVAEGLQKGDMVIVAGDLRDSTPRILQAVVKATQDSGYTPIYAGLIPTPALALYALRCKAPGIMVTGSHIPSDRNGIKFYKKSGEVLKEDESFIKESVAKTRKEIYETKLSESSFDTTGMFNQPIKLPKIDQAGEELFIERFTQLGNDMLSGKLIVVYQHSAVGRDMLRSVLEALGATVMPVGRSDTFIPIDTENVTAENQAYFRLLAQKFPNSFAIVSTDGDSDRPFVIDETGEFHRGDVLGAVVAKELGSDFAAVPISTNDAVDSYCEESSIRLVHTKIGSPYVISAMMAREEIYKTVVGWEVNGGFMTATDVTFCNHLLKPLHTRDAFLPIIVTLIKAAGEQKKVSEIFKVLPKRFTSSGLIDNIEATKIKRFRELAQKEASIKPITEKLFRSTSLGIVREVNVQDGLRLVFDNNAVLHLRPSGNAPQFRVYTNADSPSQAEKLVEESICEGGYIDRLLQEL